MIKKLWNNEFLQGSFFLTVSSFLINILNYLFYLLIARSLGPRGYGEIYTLLSYISISSVIISVSSMLIIQKIGSADENRYEIAKALESWFWIKTRKYWFFIIPMVILTPFMPKITNLSPVTAFMIFPIVLISFFSSFYSASLQGLKLFFWSSVISILCALFKFGGGILISLGIKNVNIIIIFLFTTSIISFFLSRLIISKTIKKWSKYQTIRLQKKLIQVITGRFFITTLLSVLALAFFGNLDIIFVKKYFSADDAGIYSLWSLFSKIILYIVGPILAVSFVFFSSQKNSETQNKTLRVSLITLMFVGIIGSLIYKIFGLLIVNVFFGTKFVPVQPYLIYAGVFGSFYTSIVLINNYFLAKKSPYTLILACLIPIYIGFLFLIPKQLIEIIRLNILFSGFTAFVYIATYLKTIK